MASISFLTRFLLVTILVSSPLLAGSVSLAWDPNTEADLAGYWVYRTQTSGSNYIRLNSSPNPSASYIDNTVVAGGTYYYAVTAVNTGGLESGKSGEVQAVVPNTPPPPPPPTNQSPIANAGLDQTVQPGSLVTLRCGSSDPDGDALARSWTQVSGPTVAMTGGSGAIATFPAPSVTNDVTLVFRLTVSDGKGGTASDDVNVIVDVNSPPTANAGPDQAVRPGSPVRLSGSGSDPEGDSLRFSWSQIEGPAVTLTGAESAMAEFVAPTINGDTYLIFRLQVTDAKSAQATDDVRVKVTKKREKFVIPASLKGVDPMVENSFIGIAVLNNSSEADTVQIAAVDSSGSEQVVKSTVFEPQAQDAFLADAVTPATPGVISLRAEANVSDLRGFFMIGRGNPNQLDGVGGELTSGTELFFPVAQADRNGKSFYFLTNTDASQAAHLAFSLVDSAGNPIRTGSLSLPPGASNLASLPSLMGVDVLSSEHYLRVTSDVAVQGFELMVNALSYSSAGGQTQEPVQKLWIPHYVVGREGEDTELRLINPKPEFVQATLKIHNDQGVLRATRNLTIPAQGLKLVRLSDLLSLATVPTEERFLTGYIAIEVSSSVSASPALLGTATFTGTRGRAASTLPMWRQPLGETLYLQVAQSQAESLFTGLTVMNPNDGPATVTVRAWTKDGQPSAEKTVTVEPGQRLVDLLGGSTWFGPGFEQVGGHLKVSSNVPVVSFVVFGDSAGEFFAAVEGQPAVEK